MLVSQCYHKQGITSSAPCRLLYFPPSFVPDASALSAAMQPPHPSFLMIVCLGQICNMERLDHPCSSLTGRGNKTRWSNIKRRISRHLRRSTLSRVCWLSNSQQLWNAGGSISIISRNRFGKCYVPRCISPLVRYCRKLYLVWGLGDFPAWWTYESMLERNTDSS